MPTAPTGAAIIVSGGTFGIGRQIVFELARRGHRIVAFGLESRQPGSVAENGIDATREALARAGLEADLLEADVASADDVKRVVQHTQRAYGGIAALVNNAAIRPTGTVLETDEAVFDRVLAVNLKGPFLLCRAVIPSMRSMGGGSIVNVGSGASGGRAGLAAYAASKGGLHALTLALAEDHRQDGIRVNLVVPGSRTSSGMVEAMDAGLPEAASLPQKPSTAVGRVVAFLVSGKSASRTGTVIDADAFEWDGVG